MLNWTLFKSYVKQASDKLDEVSREKMPACRYMKQCWDILPAVVAENPNYKTQVGHVLYPYVEKLVGKEHTPMVTQMLIDCPIADVRMMMENHEHFKARVNQAFTVLGQKVEVVACSSTEQETASDCETAQSSVDNTAASEQVSDVSSAVSSTQFVVKKMKRKQKAVPIQMKVRRGKLRLF